MDNDWKKRLGVVYSTNPDFEYNGSEDNNDPTPVPTDQLLYISLDKRNRKGKKVTLVTGFIGNDDDLKELGKILKTRCGVGGSTKDGEIIIQGDFRDKIVSILEDMEYKVKRKGG